MRAFWHEDYVAPLAPGHRFPMSKYRATRDAMAGLPIAWARPEPVREADIVRVHEAAYAQQVLASAVPPLIEREIGFPVTAAVARRSLLSVGGTTGAARAALDHGFAANLAGGSHHARPAGGAGFCVLNDLAIAAATLIERGEIRRIAILDLDVHQGDGTALCLDGRKGMFTLSIHAERNYPVRKARSSLDIGLPDGTGDAAYLEALTHGLARLFDIGRPDLVLVQAGVDPHADDRLGRLCLSDAGLLARDAMVREACLSRGVPFAATLGGGYDRDVARLGRRHAATLVTLGGLSPAKETGLWLHKENCLGRPWRAA